MHHSRLSSWSYQQTLDQTEKLAIDKHSSLLRKFVNYGQKSFLTFLPGLRGDPGQMLRKRVRARPYLPHGQGKSGWASNL